MRIGISAQKPTTSYPRIIIQRPASFSTEENNYRYIFCELVEELQEKPYSLKEELITTDEEDYSITIILSMNEEQKKELLLDRADIAKALQKIITELQPQEVES